MLSVYFLHLRYDETLLSLFKALCSWGHVTTIFLRISYIMDYNLKNARSGKSISKIPEWRSLRLKSRLIRQFEFLENLEYIYGK